MSRRFALIPVAAAALLASAAQAQTAGDTSRPWFVGINQAVAHESGVVANGSDTNYTTALRGGLDMRLGRGRAFVDGTLRHQRYQDNDVLNNNGWDVRGGLDWETQGNLSGSFNGATTRRLTRFVSERDSSLVLRNLETLSDLEARARLGGNGPLSIEGGLGRRELYYSAPESDHNEFRENRVSLGVAWRPGGALTLGTGVAARKADYPRFQEVTPEVFVADHSTRREVYVTANYDTGGRSVLSSRLALTRVRYDLNTGNDFSGVTGNITWGWKPTGKITVTSALSRDTGSEQQFTTLTAPVGTTSPSPQTSPSPSSPGTPTTPVGTTQPLVSSFQGVATIARVVNQVSTRVDYEATAKISAVAGLAYARQSGGESGRENIVTLSLGARWLPTRAISVGCDVTHENRDRTDAGAAASTPNARRFGCFGEFLIH